MIHIIVNPAGAGGRTKRLWTKLEPLLGDAGYEVHYTREGQTAGDIAASLTGPGEGTVDLVILGGDGTMNELVNGIRDFSRTRVGLIPSGSANDLAKSLDLSKKPEELLSSILEGKTLRMLDVGQVLAKKADGSSFLKRFVESAGLGFDAAVCAEVASSRLKKVFNRLSIGKLIYLFVAARLIFRSETVPAVLDLYQKGGEKKQLQLQRMNFAAIMNNPYEGGGFYFCPNAESSDGILDLCAVHDLKTLEFFRFFPRALTGKHVSIKTRIEIAQAEKIRIQAEEPLWLHFDGETDTKVKEAVISLTGEKLQLLI